MKRNVKKEIETKKKSKVTENSAAQTNKINTRRLYIAIGVVLIAVGLYFMRVRIPVPKSDVTTPPTITEQSKRSDEVEMNVTNHRISVKKAAKHFTFPFPYKTQQICVVKTGSSFFYGSKPEDLTRSGPCYIDSIADNGHIYILLPFYTKWIITFICCYLHLVENGFEMQIHLFNAILSINVYEGETQIEVIDYDVDQNFKMKVDVDKKLEPGIEYNVQLECTEHLEIIPPIKRKEKTHYTDQEKLEYYFIETCRVGDIEEAKRLIEQGVDINTHTGSFLDHTALHWASKNGHAELVKLLLDHGAQIDMLSEEEVDAIHYAAFEGHKVVLDVLLERGADINSRDKSDGSTPLHTAALWNRIEIVKYFLKRGVDIEIRTDKGETPLHRAAWWGSLNTTKILVENEAAINVKNIDGETPLGLAKKMNRTKVIEYLESKGAHS